jgi:acid phosphatase (class A)
MVARRKLLAGVVAFAVAAAGAWHWHDDHTTRFLPDDTAAFIATFPAPPARDSAQTRTELDHLLALQRSRTAGQVSAAQRDRKTEIARFYGALGLDTKSRLPRVESLAQGVEDDVRQYVRAAKDHFRRLRPFVIDARLDPCLNNVKADLSFPSGHAAYAWSMAYLLAAMVPERRAALEARATEFARQRMVCGVHFPSDLAAGQQAARWLLREMASHREFLAQGAEATAELRARLGLPPRTFSLEN